MIDNSDGVDYVRHSLFSEKQAPMGDYEPCDGSVRINLDEIYDEVQEQCFMEPELNLIALYIDTLSHELFHKFAVWGMGEDFNETFNEMDERAMRVCSDWIYKGKMTKFSDYDWKH